MFIQHKVSEVRAYQFLELLPEASNGEKETDFNVDLAQSSYPLKKAL